MREVCDTAKAPPDADQPWLDLVNAIDEPAGLLNSRREFTAVNSRLLSLLGLKASEVSGLRIGQSVGCLNWKTTPSGCGSGPKCRECGANMAILQGQAGKIATETCRWRLPVGTDECFIDFCIWTFPIETQHRWTLIVIPDDNSEERHESIANTLVKRSVLST